jgi:O-antigen/teichoic acid export membrane protein
MTNSPYSGRALRENAWHFLTGRAVTGLLTFVILLSVVRLLPVQDYAAYVTFYAGVELLFTISGLGLPWWAARYVPEYRLNANGPRLCRIVYILLAFGACSLACVVALVGLFITPYLDWMRLTHAREAAELFLIIAMTEGIGRQVQESLLGPLMQQRVSRASLVLRQLTFVTLIAVIAARGQADLKSIVLADLVASCTGTGIAVLGLFRHLTVLDSAPGVPGWREPPLQRMWRTALHMYAVHIVTLLYSPQALLLLVQRMLGAESAAVFGFLRSLFVHIARYLPATLLFNLVRPKLVASYVGGGGIRELSKNANLAGKLSLFVLMPLLAIAALGGEELVAFLSGDKFTGTGLLFFGIMLAMVPFSQRQLLEAVAVTAGQSALCMWAATSGFLMPPLVLGLLYAGAGLWAPIAALALGHMVFNAIILLGMMRVANYQPDVVGFRKLLGCALVAFLGALWLPRLDPALLNLAAEALVAITVFLVSVWLIKPFAKEETSRLVLLVMGRSSTL